MTTSSRPWLLGWLCLVSVLVLSLSAQAHPEQAHQGIAIDAPAEAVQSKTPALASKVQIQLVAQPPLSEIVPAHQPVRLRLEAANRQHQPVQNAQWQITLNTPAKTPWLSSDFPMVEGTPLLNANLTSATNLLELETMLPIRGSYTLQATIAAPGINVPVAQTFVLDVPENPVKYRNAATLAVILLLVGLLGGWLIAKQPRGGSKELSQSVRLLLSGAAMAAIVALLVVNISAENAEHSQLEPLSLSRTTAEVGSLKLEYLGDTIATVGKLADLSARLIDTRTNQPVQDTTFRLQAKDLEHGMTVLSVAGKPDANGVFTWQQQFFDGAPHQIQFEAVSPANSAPLTLAQAIDIESIAPPLSVRLMTLGYMTAIVGIGMVVGFGAGRMRSGSRYRKSSVKPDTGRI